MIEEAEHPFPPPENETSTNHNDEPNGNSESEPTGTHSYKEPEQTPEHPDPRISDIAEEIEEPNDDGGPPLGASSSTGSDGDTTGPSTAENSISQAPPIEYESKQIVGGRASIPEELEPHQLARLKDLKESNA